MARKTSTARKVHEFSYLLRSVHPYIILAAEHTPVVKAKLRHRRNAKQIKEFLAHAAAQDQLRS